MLTCSLLFFRFALIEGSALFHHNILTTPFRTHFCSQAQMYRFDAVCHVAQTHIVSVFCLFILVVLCVVCCVFSPSTRCDAVESTDDFLPSVWRTKRSRSVIVRLLNFIYMILIALFMVFCDDSRNQIEKERKKRRNICVVHYHRSISFICG